VAPSPLARRLSAALLGLLLCLSGCAAPPVRVEPPELSAFAPVSTAVQVAVADLRPEVDPAQLGVIRTTMGIPRTVRLAGEREVAAGLAESLAAGLNAANLRAEVVPYQPPGSEPPASVAPVGSGARRLQLVIDELWSDGYFGELSVKFALRLHVLDGAGQLLARAERRAKPVTPYGGSEDYSDVVGAHLRAALSALLERPQIRAALGGAPPPPEDRAPDAPPEEPAACAQCGEPRQPGWRHCPQCGSALR